VVIDCGKYGRTNMKRKTQRAMFIGSGMAVLAIAVGLSIFALDDSLNFFLSPSEVQAGENIPANTFRLGGLVEEGSFTEGENMAVSFTVTDTAADIAIEYDQQEHGLLPDLFREGQGVILEGTWGDGVFTASRVLAKHDENYMPPEVADALKEAGEWRGEGQPENPELPELPELPE
jgi:cytochrome c-type biogenesis protein CcmE